MVHSSKEFFPLLFATPPIYCLPTRCGIFQKQVLLGKEISAQWTIAVYYNMPGTAITGGSVCA